MTTITKDISGFHTLTVDKTAAFLRELASQVGDERRFHDKPFTEFLPELLPLVTSALCVNPLACFDRLVDALAELSSFDGDESGYSDTHGLARTDVALAVTRDRLTSAVDAALQALLGAGA